jgi:hypothetical protein
VTPDFLVDSRQMAGGAVRGKAVHSLVEYAMRAKMAGVSSRPAGSRMHGMPPGAGQLKAPGSQQTMTLKVSRPPAPAWRTSI